MNATTTPQVTYPADAPYVITDVREGYSEDSWKANDFGRIEFRMYSRYARHECNFLPYVIGPAGEARQVQYGDMVPGPWGFMTALATVISAEPGRPVKRVQVTAGDHIKMAGHVWKIVDDKPMDYPSLEWVAESPATRDELLVQYRDLSERAQLLHVCQMAHRDEYRQKQLDDLYDRANKVMAQLAELDG